MEGERKVDWERRVGGYCYDCYSDWGKRMEDAGWCDTSRTSLSSNPKGPKSTKPVQPQINGFIRKFKKWVQNISTWVGTLKPKWSRKIDFVKGHIIPHMTIWHVDGYEHIRIRFHLTETTEAVK